MGKNRLGFYLGKYSMQYIPESNVDYGVYLANGINLDKIQIEAMYYYGSAGSDDIVDESEIIIKDITDHFTISSPLINQIGDSPDTLDFVFSEVIGEPLSQILDEKNEFLLEQYAQTYLIDYAENGMSQSEARDLYLKEIESLISINGYANNEYCFCYPTDINGATAYKKLPAENFYGDGFRRITFNICSIIDPITGKPKFPDDKYCFRGLKVWAHLNFDEKVGYKYIMTRPSPDWELAHVPTVQKSCRVQFSGYGANTVIALYLSGYPDDKKGLYVKENGVLVPIKEVYVKENGVLTPIKEVYEVRGGSLVRFF